MWNLDAIKEAREFDRFKQTPHYAPHGYAISQEALEAMAAAFPNLIESAIEGPKVAP
jgi:hypothetical protein